MSTNVNMSIGCPPTTSLANFAESTCPLPCPPPLSTLLVHHFARPHLTTREEEQQSQVYCNLGPASPCHAFDGPAHLCKLPIMPLHHHKSDSYPSIPLPGTMVVKHF